MPNRTNKNKQHEPAGRRPRKIRVVSVLRDEPDLEKIASTLIALATTDIGDSSDRIRLGLFQPDPYACDCACNCCKLRRIHDGLCPQPSDEQLEEARRHTAA